MERVNRCTGSYINDRVVAYVHEIATKHLNEMSAAELELILNTHKLVKSNESYGRGFDAIFDGILGCLDHPEVDSAFTPEVFKRIEENWLDLDRLAIVCKPN